MNQLYNLQDNKWVLVKSKNNKYTYNNPNKYNYKKILCKNINNCPYTTKCKFAHSIDEQIIDHVRRKAYNMIKYNIDLSTINLRNNNNLYNNLLCLTKLCTDCIKNICTGGYNCKHGACIANLVICKLDLDTGKCDNTCNKIHLTKKGLKPYTTEYMTDIPQSDTLSEIYFDNKDISININTFSDSDSEDNYYTEFNKITIKIDVNNDIKNDENLLNTSIFHVYTDSI